MGGEGFFSHVDLGHVAPILISALIAISIAGERIIALFHIYPIKNTAKFFDRIQDLVMGGRMSEAISLCDRYSTKPIARIVKNALQRAHQPENLIENGLEIAIERETQTISRRSHYLGTIANVVTLMGLLGTVAGLISSFEAIGRSNSTEKAALLAQGISEAMTATIMGLSVAIPCLIAFSFLMNRTNTLTSQIESSALEVMDILKQYTYASETLLDFDTEDTKSIKEIAETSDSKRLKGAA